jgi:hypothetical protein
MSRDFSIQGEYRGFASMARISMARISMSFGPVEHGILSQGRHNTSDKPRYPIGAANKLNTAGV